MRMKRTYLLLLGLGLCFSLQAGGGIAWSQVTERVSVDSAGAEVDDPSYSPSISADGRYIAFESISPDLVTGDTNGKIDIFVHDRDADGNGTYDEPGAITTVRVSVASGGGEGSEDSHSPSISGDGMHVAFESSANDLVAVDINPLSDMFVHDLLGGTTTVVSVNSAGAQDPIPSSSSSPSLTSNGRYVAFDSDAALVATDSNGFSDIFVHDRDADGNGTYDEPGPVGISTVRVSVDSAGVEVDDPSYAPSISADGRYVAFESISPDLVAGDGNGQVDIFVHDRDADGNGTYDEPGPVGISTVRVSVDSGGSEVNGDSYAASISDDGRYVAFVSDAPDLVADDTNLRTDVFVHDRQTGATTRVSVNLTGVEGNNNSNNPSISADGSSVAFVSDATNLVGDDTNGVPDIFVDDLQAAGGEDEGGGNGNSSSGCFIDTARYSSRVAKEVK